MKKIISTILILSLNIFVWSNGGWGGGSDQGTSTTDDVTFNTVTATDGFVSGGTPAISSRTGDALNIPSYYTDVQTLSFSSGALTYNCNLGLKGILTLDNGANVLTITNYEEGMNLVFILIQPSSGAAGTLTFSPSPYCPSGTHPEASLTATNGHYDIICMFYLNGAMQSGPAWLDMQA